MKIRLAVLVSRIAAFGHMAAATAPAAAPDLATNPRSLNPPPGIVVPVAIKAELEAGVEALGGDINGLRIALRSQPALLALLPDVQVYHNAVRYALTDDIFTGTNQFGVARMLLQQGRDRAQQLAAGKAPWNTKAGLLILKKEMDAKAAGRSNSPPSHVPIVRGYLSRIDGSVQPYGLLVPVNYLEGDDHPRRLDFWLHGRGDTLNELAFIEGRQRPGSEFLPPDTFVLHPYGRFMNAFKFAGETDVFEALESTAQQYPVDRKRIAMRGFSMGGAGAWHLGAHHADQFAAVNPGAGFVDVKNYQKLNDRLATIPWWEQKLWNLYDPLACPINLLNSTLVAYSGEDDAQKAAADLMEASLLREGVRMTHIIGPKTGHKYEPEARKTVARLVDAAANQGIEPVPRKISWVTHTLQFHRAHWLTVDALEEHWKEARVDANLIAEGEAARIEIKTRNVAALSVAIVPATLVGGSAKLVIDGQDLGARRTVFTNPSPGQAGSWWTYSATKKAGRWLESGPYADTGLAKRHGLQGPIDDAFTDSFLMVRPTGVPFNETVGQWVKAELSEATFHWRRYFRGEARVKDDRAVTDDDIQSSNLVLWGDPSSNTLLARIADRLPIRWTPQGIVVGDKTYDATKHVPVFIFPNPLNPKRYVVINSGFTFPQFAAASNSLQTPKLPDWAILDMGVPMAARVGGKGIVDANFFGERWELKQVER